MAGEGVILQKAREEKGWTYHDVEEKIKIRGRYLAALENEDYNVLPGQTYTRGFLRTYSKLLGINSDEIINLYNSSFAKEPVPDIQPPLTPIQSTPVWFKPIVVLVMAFIAIAIVVGITYFSQAGNNPLSSGYTPTPLPTAPPTNTPAPNTQGQNASGTTPSVQTPAQPQVPVEVKYEGIVAEVSFEQDCWLKVRIDGVIVQEGMSPAGTSKIFQGNERVEFLIIGNAGGLGLKINGKNAPSLGALREVVYNYVITQETIASM